MLHVRFTRFTRLAPLSAVATDAATSLAAAAARFAAAAILSPVLATAQAPPQPGPTALQKKVEEARRIAEQLRESLHIPGLSVAVAARGRLVFTEAFGWADLEQKVPVTRLTKFRIGSVSKLLTAAALARLVESGKIDLDAAVRTYVPYFTEKEHEITIAQLASHTSGIRHYGPNDGLDRPQYYPTVREGLAIFADDPLLFEPGSKYQYSSYGYNLLSAAIEGASGMDFPSYVRVSVLEPLGLHSTRTDDRFEIVPYRTRFYHRLDEGAIVHTPEVDNSYKWASGGYLSSAEDLVHLGLAHVEPGLFDKRTLDTIFTPRPGTDRGEYQVGLGWRISKDDDGVMYHHGGSIAGGRAFLYVDPESRSAVAILSNLYTGFGLEEARHFAAVFSD